MEYERSRSKQLNQEQCRNILRECSKDLIEQKDHSNNTVEKYQKMLKTLGRKTPREYCESKNLSKSTYYMYRSAALHAYSTVLNRSLNDLDKARSEKDQEAAKKARNDMRTFAKKLKEIYNDKYEYKKTPSRQRLKQLQMHHGEEIGQEIAERRMNRKSKRKSISRLTERDWDNILQKSPNKYRDTFAVLHATGARPSELQRGVEIIANNDTIRVKIYGSKYDKNLKGHEKRELYFDRHSGNGKIINEYILKDNYKNNSILTVSTPKDVKLESVEMAYKRTCKKSVGRGDMSMYSARHQFAANLKAEGWSRTDIAQAMGHQSEASQGHYGHHTQGKGASGLQAVQASGPVRAAPGQGPRSGAGPRPG